MIPVDISVETLKAEIWGWVKGFFELFFHFYLFKSLKSVE